MFQLSLFWLLLYLSIYLSTYYLSLYPSTYRYISIHTHIHIDTPRKLGHRPRRDSTEKCTRPSAPAGPKPRDPESSTWLN